MKIEYEQYSSLHQFYNLASDFIMSHFEADEIPEKLKHAGVYAGLAIIVIDVKNREEIDEHEAFEDFFDEMEEYDEE